MIRIACSDYTFPLLPPKKRFALIKLLGFSHVDIGLFKRDSHLKPGQLAANPKIFTRKLKSDLRDANLSVSDIFLQVGSDPTESAVNDPSRSVRSLNRNIFQHALDLCSALGCTHLTGLPGVRHLRINETEDLALAYEETLWRVDTARTAGIAYAIEPHVGSLCSDVTRARAFVECVPGLTLTLDYGHFVFTNTHQREIHSLLPLASHFHLRGGAPGKLQVPVAESTIDFRGIVSRLQKRKFSGFLAVEYVWTSWQQCNHTDNVSETILLRQSITRPQRNGRGDLL